MAAVPDLCYEVTWKPFFLDATLPRDGKNKLAHYKTKFGEDRVAQMLPGMKKTFRDEGIEGYTLDGKVANTLDSHRLMELAGKQGGAPLQDKLVELLFEAYFTQAKNIGDTEVLVQAAAVAGVTDAPALLACDGLKQEVLAGVDAAYAKRVSGVPHFTIDGEHTVSGGQESAVFINILRKLVR